MQLLHNAARFTKEKSHPKSIYTTFIRPVLEQSCVVWHSSLTAKNTAVLEKIQKSAVRLIMGNKQLSYEEALLELKLDNLSERRRILSLTFAKRSLNINKVKSIFPKRREIRNQTRRFTEKVIVNKSKTERLRKSAVPYMQSLLNEEASQKEA